MSDWRPSVDPLARRRLRDPSTSGERLGALRRILLRAGGLVFFLVLVGSVAVSPAAAQPTISIQSPRPGDTLYTSTLIVSGTATNATRVQVCLASACQNASTVEMWSVTFDLSSFTDGTYPIEACAYGTAGPPACAPPFQLMLSRTYLIVETLLETYLTPILASIGVALTALVALAPRWYKVGEGLASALATAALAALGIRLITAPFSLPHAVAALLIVSVLGVHRLSRPKVPGDIR